MGLDIGICSGEHQLLSSCLLNAAPDLTGVIMALPDAAVQASAPTDQGFMCLLDVR